MEIWQALSAPLTFLCATKFTGIFLALWNECHGATMPYLYNELEVSEKETIS